MNQKELEIYIHIPFCIKKCSYCDFLSGPATEQTVESYMAALFAEIEGKSGKYRDRRVVSVFIGGGTPSRLTGEQMGKLMACIRRHFSLAHGGRDHVFSDKQDRRKAYHAAKTLI